ncbi:restriction endonuclease, partial [Candidatus Babeliales bacterium]|nr:restriction endonuclease [Candidatus Babeliales bacterium]
MTIKILAKSEKRKGMLFERVIVTLLETLGYEGLKTNVLKSGSEIDIEGKSKITRQPFFCECKATKRKIDSSTFQQFVGKFLLEKIKNKDIVGLFFTLSPLTSATLENYADLKNTKYKSHIILYEGRDILKLLIESKLIVSEDLIDDKLKNIGYTFRDKYLVYTENGPYWVQILKEDSKSLFFTIFDCYGNFLSKAASEEIKELDENLSNKKYIGERVYEEIPAHSDLESILAKKFDELKENLFLEIDKKSVKYLTTSDLEVVEEKRIIEKDKILKNPFDGYSSAEMATDDQIATLFIEPPGFDVIKNKVNIIIEGNRGTGRSMLLRYLSIGAQIEMLRENKNGYNLPFLGVYIKSSGAWLTAGRKESEISVLWVRLFTHFFNMMVFSRILSAVNLTERTKVVELTDKEKLNVIEEMLKLWKVPDSQKENNKYPKLSLDFLEESVNQEIRNTLRCLNTLELGLDESYFEGSLTNNHFLEDMCSILVDNIHAYRDKQFYILLDEYERYSESQQKIINGIINSSMSISFKIATTPFGMTFKTINDIALEKYHEFQFYDLNSIWYKSNDYKMFLKNLGNELLRYSFNGLDIDTLFPKDNNKKYLSGVDTFAILSSGVVTDFIQICRVAFDKAIDKSMNVHEGISPKIQDASIREISQNKIHGLKTISPKGMQLQNVINTLANIFRENYLKNGRETLEIEILEPYKLKTELKE